MAAPLPSTGATGRRRRPRIPLVISEASSMQALSFEHRMLEDTIGLVPTMGALHDGHLALIREARKRADVVVVSVFVNPKQFGDPRDLAAYPESLEDDLQACASEGVDIVFAPAAHRMYPPTFDTAVKAGALARRFEGKSRPGHFDGVLTVVTKLFHLCQPHFSVFGEKDYQQLQLVRRLVRDLNLPLEIVAMPVIRAPDGLALSSRNARLNKADRKRATCLYRAICAAQDLADEGERRTSVLKDAARAALAKTKPFLLDYCDVVDPVTLAPIRTVERSGRLLLAGALRGKRPVRLIDNAPLYPAS